MRNCTCDQAPVSDTWLARLISKWRTLRERNLHLEELRSQVYGYREQLVHKLDGWVPVQLHAHNMLVQPNVGTVGFFATLQDGNGPVPSIRIFDYVALRCDLPISGLHRGPEWVMSCEL